MIRQRLSTDAHDQPGRRFAADSNRNDHLLGFFGFFAHGYFFTAIGAGVCLLWPDAALPVFIGNAAAASLCLIVRGRQVGLRTTIESVKAIKKAWLG
jgi:hypothetical protein